MSGIVEVKYPIPVRHVPHRGHRERLAFGCARMPVRLRRNDASEFTLVHAPKFMEAVQPFYAHRGSLWTRLNDYSAMTVSGNPPLPAEKFVAWLSGTMSQVDRSRAGIVHHLFRTPLCAASVDPVSFWERGQSGDELGPRVLERAVEDLSAACGAAVRRFLDEEVALVGGHVFVRASGPQIRTDGMVAAILNPREQGAASCVRLDRHAEAVGIGLLAANQFIPNYEDARRRIDPALLRDDDLDLFFNHGPAVLLGWAGRLFATDNGRGVKVAPDGGEGALDPLLERLPGLRSLQARGTVGVVPRESWAHAFDLMDGFVSGLERAYPGMIHGLDRFALYMRRYVAPRIEPELVPGADDLQALEGLGGLRP